MKFRFISLLVLAALYLGVVTGNFGPFMLVFALSGLTMKYQPGVFSACVSTCELTDITESDDCKIRGGIKTAYWTEYNSIDWEDMASDPLKFDTATETVLGYTMVGGAVFKKLTFGRKNGFYDFTFTEDTDVYEQLITMIFEGKSNANRLAFKKSLNCCRIVLHIFDNNCLERIVGVEWDGASFEPQVKTLRIGRHLDSSGQSGDSKSRDEFDLVGESLFAPLFSTVGETNIPLT
jgi:hypothetical protein